MFQYLMNFAKYFKIHKEKKISERKMPICFKNLNVVHSMYWCKNFYQTSFFDYFTYICLFLCFSVFNSLVCSVILFLMWLVLSFINSFSLSFHKRELVPGVFQISQHFKFLLEWKSQNDCMLSVANTTDLHECDFVLK